MKVVSFVGSPRKNGNTSRLVEEVLHGAASAGAETKMFYINELNIKGCQSCYACKKKEKCILQDDMVPLYDEIASADAVVFGTPVYMWQMTGQLKLLIDRLFAFLNPDYTSRLAPGKKIALVVTQGDADETRYVPYFDSVGKMLQTGGCGLYEILVAGGVYELGQVAGRSELLAKARILGRNLVK